MHGPVADEELVVHGENDAVGAGRVESLGAALVRPDFAFPLHGEPRRKEGWVRGIGGCVAPGEIDGLVNSGEDLRRAEVGAGKVGASQALVRWIELALRNDFLRPAGLGP